MSDGWLVIEAVDGTDYTLRWRSAGFGSVTVEAFMLASTALDGGDPQYNRKDWRRSGDDTADLDEAAPVFRVEIMANECAHWEFPAEPTLWHTCKPEDVDELHAAMRAAYALLPSPETGFRSERRGV